MWKSFKDHPHAADILADFGLLDRYQAQRLTLEFWRELGVEVDIKPIYPPAPHNENDFEW